jgi:hypothetical protein
MKSTRTRIQPTMILFVVREDLSRKPIPRPIIQAACSQTSNDLINTNAPIPGCQYHQVLKYSKRTF